MALFFWDDDFIALTDDNELLIHDGADEAPLWRRSVKETIVGVARVGQEVVTLDKGGGLRYWDLAHGEETQIYSVPDNPLGLSLAYEQQLVVVTNKEVLLFDNGQQVARQRVKMPESAAFSADGSRIAVASATGACTICTNTLEPIVTTEVTEMFGHNIVWSPRGYWLMTAGKGVYLISGKGDTVKRMTGSQGSITSIACNPDGTRFAVLIDKKLALLINTKSKDVLAQVQMKERTISDIFVPNDEWLTLGLVGGDANKVSLLHEMVVKRTDTHPGRQHNSWLLSINIPIAKDRPKPPPPAEKPVHTPQPKVQTAAAAPEKPKRTLLQRGGRWVLWILLAVFALLIFCGLVGTVLGGVS